MWLVEQLLIQFLGRSIQVNLVEATPEIQDVAALFAAKAME
jgi:hypothetical protein